jgi:anti-anti-sigma factor
MNSSSTNSSNSSNPTNPTNLSIWVNNGSACIKVRGRANCNASVSFKSLIRGLYDRGHRRFILDLEDCLIMDSTFLGVLAGLGQHFESTANGTLCASIELCNPSDRITELLDNLGVSHLFKVLDGPPTNLSPVSHTEILSKGNSHKELCKTSLEAHQTLMEINPDNVPKFKEVARFLAEDLKQAEP